MTQEEFAQSTIGADYLQKDQYYPTDALLEYLFGLLKMREDNAGNPVWVHKYTLEINAVKQILKYQTA